MHREHWQRHCRRIAASLDQYAEFEIECQEVTPKFEDFTELSHMVGAINGFYIPLKITETINSKTSLNLQLVVYSEHQ